MEKNRESQTLEIIVKNKLYLTSLMKCMSLMEYTGTKWIMVLPANVWTEELFDHCRDELAHTKMMDDLYLQLRETLTGEELLIERENTKQALKLTDKYFARLIAGAYRPIIKGRMVDDSTRVATYALTSLLIERRILKLYSAFVAHSDHEAVREVSKQLILDEKDHLTLVRSKLDALADQFQLNNKQLFAMEDELFENYISKLSEVLFQAEEHVEDLLGELSTFQHVLLKLKEKNENSYLVSRIGQLIPSLKA